MKLPFLRRRPTPADLPPVRALAKPKPVAVAPRTAEPEPETPTPTGPGPVFQPGRYVVQYSRTLGPVAVAPLTVITTSAADLTEHIRRDLEPYLGRRIEITVDMVVSGGKIRAGATTGTFVFTRGGGAR
jgi:hypothetical protein